jgi:hypothetical protein
MTAKEHTSRGFAKMLLAGLKLEGPWLCRYFSDFTSTFEFRPLLSYFSRRLAGRESGVVTV